MEDADRMGFGKRVARLEQKVDGMVDGESAAPNPQDVERCALQDLQHYVWGARIRGPRVEKAHHMLALELGHSLPPRLPDSLRTDGADSPLTIRTLWARVPTSSRSSWRSSARSGRRSARVSLVAENLATRQQLAVLRRRTKRARLTPLDRAFWIVL